MTTHKIACVADALNLLYRDGLYKWFRGVRGPNATQATHKNVFIKSTSRVVHAAVSLTTDICQPSIFYSFTHIP